MEKHSYKGTLACCLKCFRQPGDAIHMPAVQISRVDLIEPDLNNSNIKPPNRVLSSPLPDADIDLFSVMQAPDPASDPGEIPATFYPEIEVSTQDANKSCSAIEQTPEVSCGINHRCPSCQRIWHHDYTCTGKENQEALCSTCAMQAAVEIGRPVTIEQYAQTASQCLTGQESAQIMMEHESFVLNTLIIGRDGKEYPDWQERVNVHIRDLKRKIEILRVQALATSKANLSKIAEMATRLSPEELAQYKRNAAKQAAGGKVKTPGQNQVAKKVTADEAYKKMLKGLCADIRTRKPDMAEDEVIAMAKKKYDIMKDMED